MLEEIRVWVKSTQVTSVQAAAFCGLYWLKAFFVTRVCLSFSLFPAFFFYLLPVLLYFPCAVLLFKCIILLPSGEVLFTFILNSEVSPNINTKVSVNENYKSVSASRICYLLFFL